MDPNETLRQLIDAICIPRTGAGNPSSYDRVRDIKEMSENLTRWISSGGFLPTDPRKGN